MRSLVAVAAAAVVLLSCSTAVAGWAYVGPAVVAPPPTVVHSFYPVGPVYAYPAPAVAVAPRVVYRPPVVAGPPVVHVPAVVAVPAVVVRPKVYVRGQPVRNVLRAVLP